MNLIADAVQVKCGFGAHEFEHLRVAGVEEGSFEVDLHMVAWI